MDHCVEIRPESSVRTRQMTRTENTSGSSNPPVDVNSGAEQIVDLVKALVPEPLDTSQLDRLLKCLQSSELSKNVESRMALNLTMKSDSMNPANVVSILNDLLPYDLDRGQRILIHQIVSYKTPGHILILQENPTWSSRHGQSRYYTLIDEIAKFNLTKNVGTRRDDIGYRFMFSFNMVRDIKRCKNVMMKLIPAAFALSPLAIAAGAVGPSREPAAFSAIVFNNHSGEADVSNGEFFSL
uniref:Uncharacterized protein n=1 Tax=Spongospora subterranea TaxID=70186 RepID=A0A0H5QJR3_9EUKA|eukprot:CRZ01566.1 hypothetical protein [Spongospora subterranea]